jgi:hypothetical protein
MGREVQAGRLQQIYSFKSNCTPADQGYRLGEAPLRKLRGSAYLLDCNL